MTVQSRIAAGGIARFTPSSFSAVFSSKAGTDTEVRKKLVSVALERRQFVLRSSRFSSEDTSGYPSEVAFRPLLCAVWTFLP